MYSLYLPNTSIDWTNLKVSVKGTFLQEGPWEDFMGYVCGY